MAANVTWAGVAGALNLRGGSAIATVKGHATRLGLDVSHVVPPRPAAAADLRPDMANLDRAGSMMAAAWFMLCGREVSWPLEPCRYDLLVQR